MQIHTVGPIYEDHETSAPLLRGAFKVRANTKIQRSGHPPYTLRYKPGLEHKRKFTRNYFYEFGEDVMYTIFKALAKPCNVWERQQMGPEPMYASIYYIDVMYFICSVSPPLDSSPVSFGDPLCSLFMMLAFRCCGVECTVSS